MSAVEKLKNKKDFQILDGLLKRSKEARLSTNPYAELKKLGLSRGSEYGNLAAMINGEMGSDDTGTVRLIFDHLKKIGVNANYMKDTKNQEYIEDSFTIK